jgi:hypothetical protein
VALTDIINPWGALRRAREIISDYESERLLFETALRHARHRAAMDEKAHALKTHNLKAEIKRLEKIIADGHYRNPKTGRLGRKGEMFPPSEQTGRKA